ncbi:aldo/keto reductase family oxidoreductase [Aquimarina sp. I32.4]|uniref:aldo/keto reductase n=1 Tax=Aquimarina sp. I32.4 TaxID=2053903 RepID=UPI000CDF0E66|nr:aldo/keto reductase [Aquimarina sp. I32.4]
MKAQGSIFSPIIAGCMNWGEWGVDLSVDQVCRLIEDCLDIGVSTFDHADIYGHYTTESLFGNAIQKKTSLRGKMKLITKCGIKLVTPNRPSNKIISYDTSKEYIISSVEKSLQNLKTEYIDLLLIHRPSPLMNPQEIAEAFTELKDSGKVLSFGVSNFTITQFEVLNSFIDLITNQVEVSPLCLNPFVDGVLGQCILKKIKPMAYSVMAGGKLFSNDLDDREVRVKKVLTGLSEKYKARPDQILISWIIKHPSGIIPIVGSTKIDRIRLAVDALKITITDEEWFMIWEASEGKPVP